MEKEFDQWNKEKKEKDTGTMWPAFYEREVWWAHVGINIGVKLTESMNGFCAR